MRWGRRRGRRRRGRVKLRKKWKTREKEEQPPSHLKRFVRKKERKKVILHTTGAHFEGSAGLHQMPGGR